MNWIKTERKRKFCNTQPFNRLLSTIRSEMVAIIYRLFLILIVLLTDPKTQNSNIRKFSSRLFVGSLWQTILNTPGGDQLRKLRARRITFSVIPRRFHYLSQKRIHAIKQRPVKSIARICQRWLFREPSSNTKQEGTSPRCRQFQPLYLLNVRVVPYQGILAPKWRREWKGGSN